MWIKYIEKKEMDGVGDAGFLSCFSDVRRRKQADFGYCFGLAKKKVSDLWLFD